MCAYLCLYLPQQDPTPKAGLHKAIPAFCPLSHVTCWPLRPSVRPSVSLSVCLCAGTERRGPRSVCFSDKYFSTQIITLIALLSTSFPSCLSMRPVKVGFQRQNPGSPHILSNFPLIFAVPCQRAGTLCFDDWIISCFFPAKICLF